LVIEFLAEVVPPAAVWSVAGRESICSPALTGRDYYIPREALDIKVGTEESDGDEALALIKRHLPDFVLLNLRMPRIGDWVQ